MRVNLVSVGPRSNPHAAVFDGARGERDPRHQVRIREYLGLRSFDPGQERGLEQFLYEESCRLEQTAALLARAREYLKREGTLFPSF